jgi:titin
MVLKLCGQSRRDPPQAFNHRQVCIIEKCIPRLSLLALLALITASGQVRAGNYFQSISPTNVWWPGGVVPYRFDTNYTITATESNNILAGLREWELAADVSFIPYTTQNHYLLLQYSNDGSGTGYFLSYPFGSGTAATMMLHGLSRGLICHEGGHLFGLQHEHQRTDRNNYVVVNLQNVTGGTNGEGATAFQIDTNSTLFGRYDLESVMHYGPDTFTNGLGDSLDPLPPYEVYYHKIGNLALSIGDRATVSNLYGATIVPLTNVVTTTADGGFGSIRDAIYYANDHPGTTIRFDIPTNDPGYGNGVYTIHLLGEPPPLVSAGTIMDGTTQPGYTGKPIIAVDGSQVSPEAGSVSGLHFYGTNCTVRGLAFNNFNYSGVQFFCAQAVGNQIGGCYIGVEPNGTNAGPNNFGGVYFQFGPVSNTIGGATAASRNVISGNTYYGILINDTNTTNNSILGNYIGLDASGTSALPNIYSGIGIYGGPHNITIGGANPGAGNVISGNSQYGVFISDPDVYGVVVQGNDIGTDATGNFIVSNAYGGVGVFNGAYGVTVGGAVAGARNVISGNGGVGLYLAGPGCSNNLVQGNYLGVNASGTAALGNFGVGLYLVNGTSSTMVGGTADGDGNLISGNESYGIYISDPGTSNNVVQGNYIGADVTGKIGLGNGESGVGLGIWSAASSNLIGGTADGAANLISGNSGYDIAIGGAFLTVVQGNFIGPDITGKVALSNDGTGVGVWGGATNTLIGGTTADAANLISGHAGYGLFISDPGTSANLVQGNLVGTDITGTNALTNISGGLAIFGAASANTLGGAVAGAANVVAATASYGVLLAEPGTSNNIVQGNLIGADITGKIALSNSTGFGVFGQASSNFIAGNLIAASESYGLLISDTNTSDNVFQGNLIGTDITGTKPLASVYGNVDLQNGATANVIGGIGAGQGNVIAFARGPGIVLYGSGTTNDSIRGNSIFSNANLGINFNGGGVITNQSGMSAGPNDLQHYPLITNAFAYAAATVVEGALNSLPAHVYAVDIYRSPAPDPSGYGEGMSYVGTVNVNTGVSGNATFAFTNNSANDAGQYFSATATSPAGDTSQFSPSVLVTNLPVASAQFTGPYVFNPGAFSFGLTLGANFGYHVQATTNLTPPISWVNLTNFVATKPDVIITDLTVTNFRVRFYRVTSP